MAGSLQAWVVHDIVLEQSGVEMSRRRPKDLQVLESPPGKSKYRNSSKVLDSKSRPCRSLWLSDSRSLLCALISVDALDDYKRKYQTNFFRDSPTGGLIKILEYDIVILAKTDRASAVTLEISRFEEHNDLRGSANIGRPFLIDDDIGMRAIIDGLRRNDTMQDADRLSWLPDPCDAYVQSDISDAVSSSQSGFLTQAAANDKSIGLEENANGIDNREEQKSVSTLSVGSADAKHLLSLLEAQKELEANHQSDTKSKTTAIDSLQTIGKKFATEQVASLSPRANLPHSKPSNLLEPSTSNRTDALLSSPSSMTNNMTNEDKGLNDSDKENSQESAVSGARSLKVDMAGQPLQNNTSKKSVDRSASPIQFLHDDNNIILEETKRIPRSYLPPKDQMKLLASDRFWVDGNAQQQSSTENLLPSMISDVQEFLSHGSDNDQAEAHAERHRSPLETECGIKQSSSGVETERLNEADEANHATVDPCQPSHVVADSQAERFLYVVTDKMDDNSRMDISEPQSQIECDDEPISWPASPTSHQYTVMKNSNNRADNFEASEEQSSKDCIQGPEPHSSPMMEEVSNYKTPITSQVTESSKPNVSDRSTEVVQNHQKLQAFALNNLVGAQHNIPSSSLDVEDEIEIAVPYALSDNLEPSTNNNLDDAELSIQDDDTTISQQASEFQVQKTPTPLTTEWPKRTSDNSQLTDPIIPCSLSETDENAFGRDLGQCQDIESPSGMQIPADNPRIQSGNDKIDDVGRLDGQIDFSMPRRSHLKPPSDYSAFTVQQDELDSGSIDKLLRIMSQRVIDSRDARPTSVTRTICMDTPNRFASSKYDTEAVETEFTNLISPIAKEYVSLPTPRASRKLTPQKSLQQRSGMRHQSGEEVTQGGFVGNHAAEADSEQRRRRLIKPKVLFSQVPARDISAAEQLENVRRELLIREGLQDVKETELNEDLSSAPEDCPLDENSFVEGLPEYIRTSGNKRSYYSNNKTDASYPVDELITATNELPLSRIRANEQSSISKTSRRSTILRESNDDVARSPDLFQQYQASYEEFRGSRSKFVEACVYIEWLKTQQRAPHFTHWDDFIRVYSTEYILYALEAHEIGRSIEPCIQYFTEKVRPRYLNNVITPQNLGEHYQLNPTKAEEIRKYFNIAAKETANPTEGHLKTLPRLSNAEDSATHPSMSDSVANDRDSSDQSYRAEDSAADARKADARKRKHTRHPTNNKHIEARGIPSLEISDDHRGSENFEEDAAEAFPGEGIMTATKLTGDSTTEGSAEMAYASSKQADDRKSKSGNIVMKNSIKAIEDGMREDVPSREILEIQSSPVLRSLPWPGKSMAQEGSRTPVNQDVRRTPSKSTSTIRSVGQRVLTPSGPISRVGDINPHINGRSISNDDHFYSPAHRRHSAITSPHAQSSSKPPTPLPRMSNKSSRDRRNLQSTVNSSIPKQSEAGLSLSAPVRPLESLLTGATKSKVVKQFKQPPATAIRQSLPGTKRRITEEQKAEMWDEFQRGYKLKSKRRKTTRAMSSSLMESPNPNQ